MSGDPTFFTKIGQSLLCTGSSTQIQYLQIPVPNSPIYSIYIKYGHLGPSTVLNTIYPNYIQEFEELIFLLLNNTYIKIREILIHVQPPKPHPGFLHNKSLGRAVLSHAPCTCKIKGGIPQRGELKLSRRIALSGLLTT